MEATNVVPTQKTQRERDPKTPQNKANSGKISAVRIYLCWFWEKSLILNGVFCMHEKKTSWSL